MKAIFSSLLIFTALPLLAQSEWVNPFIGTGGHGHTYPGATAPFGMVQLSPDTRLDGWDGCSAYHYSDSAIYGFSHTHLSGTGVSDYGDILLMPMLDLKWTSEEVKAAFDHENESAEPGFYQVGLDNGIRAELTASSRVGVHRYTFPKGSKPYLLIDLLHRDRLTSAQLEIIDKQNIRGHRHSTAWAVDQKLYFHIRLSEEWKDLLKDPEHPEHRQALQFKKLKKPLTIWVGLSSTSAEAAAMNLDAEAKDKSFDDILQQTQEDWNRELGKIDVTASEEQKTIFYTALYHTMIVPNLFSDVDGKYRGMDGEVHQANGPHYTVFSLWDTYRAAHPLYTLIDHERTRDFILTFNRMFTQTGRLPVWELAGNETECMIGYHAASVLADAAVKDLSPLDAERALQIAGFSSEYPEFGMQAFRLKGYLDIEDEHESVSKTLEYGYDDFCVAQLGYLADQPALAEIYEKYALAYRNIMNDEGFMQPRSQGKWLDDFDPREVNNHFTEANSWQYSFYVPHDLQGFMHRLGGREALESQLDALFNADEATTGREQADITGLIGQYAHGNEPSHHIAYLYNTAGAPHKSQQKVKQILETMYSNSPEGLSGNEDCGQMSAWYVLSSIGFYPVCPGDPRYVIGYPALEKAKVLLGNGRKLSIEKSGNGNYIKEVLINGKSHPQNYIAHEVLMQGGHLLFVMSEEPTEWGTQAENSYLTAIETEYVSAPILQYDSPVFYDSLVVGWQNPNEHSVSIRWLAEGNVKGEYERIDSLDKDFHIITESGRLEVSFKHKGIKSPPAVVEVHRRKNRYEASWMNIPNPQYQAGGPDALVDEVYGDAEWRKGRWVGIQGEKFVAEIDMLEEKVVNALGLNCLQDVRSWICFPKKVRFYSRNTDSEEWQLDGELKIGDRSTEEGSFTEVFRIPLNKRCRYLRIEADQFGALPEWHPGAGSPSFIFVDEIVIIR